jgi:hypothetical protein
MLSTFGREDPNWRGTPPYAAPNPEEKKSLVGEDIYPPPDERSLRGYLREKRVSKNDAEGVKTRKRLGARARKEYKTSQKVAVRRKNALRAQALNLRDQVPIMMPNGEQFTVDGVPQTFSNANILTNAIGTWTDPSARQTQDAVNTVDRYERWMRGKLTPQELADINAGKLSLPTRSERKQAQQFLTKSEGRPFYGAAGTNVPTVQQRTNRELAQRLEGTSNVLANMLDNARPATDVLAGKNPTTKEALPEGSLGDSIKEVVTDRNKREADRIASGQIYDRDVAVQRGVNPKVSVAPSYIAPSARDNNSPTGIKAKTPVEIQYTPTGKQAGLRTRRDKIRRVIRLLDNEGGNDVYGKTNLLDKAKQDTELLQSQLTPDRLKQLASIGGQRLARLRDNAGQKLDEFINAPNRLPPVGEKSIKSTNGEITQQTVDPNATQPAFDIDYTATQDPLTGASSISTPEPTTTSRRQPRQGRIKTGGKATPQDKSLTINITMPDGTPAQVPSTGRTVDIPANLPNVGTKAASTAKKGEQVVEQAGRANLINKLRTLGSSDNGLLKAGAAIAGAGGVLLGGNMLANSMRKKDTVPTPTIPAPSVYPGYPPYPYV